jgi:putative membrane protein
MISALFGTALGVMTGLIPGLHVNNVAIILLSISPIAAGIMITELGLDPYTVLLMVSSSIVATSMAHTFLDFIPSTFLGAPEPETALSVLPAHGMLMEGRGYQAIFLSAVGSFGAVVIGCLLLIPYRMMVNEPINGYEILKKYMIWVLIGVVVLMLVTETSEIPYKKKDDKWVKGPLSRTMGVTLALLLFLLSGILGYTCLNLDVTSPFGLPATVLFPLLSGLFGTATLIESIRGGAEVPLQRFELDDLDLSETASSVSTGGMAGSVVGFLPGMSGGVATIIAMLFRKDPKPSSVILTLSAINTANSFFVLSALFLILRPRSGAAIVVNQLIDARKWSSFLPPHDLGLLLISALIASCLGFFLTMALGRRLANLLPRLPYSKLVISIIIFITVMVIAFTGIIGFLVLLVSTAVGMIAPNIGIRRSHAMGVLLLPVILMLW